MAADSIELILGWIELNRFSVYVILFGYCALKSGALPFFAGLVAYAGSLDVFAVIAASFLGGYLGDELRFFLARRYGDRLRRKRPRWRSVVSNGLGLLEKYGAFYIFLYRYPKGMRTIGAIPVGMGTMPWMKFTILNALSAVTWATILVWLGHALGEPLKEMVGEGWTVLSMGLLLVFVVSILFLYRKHIQHLGKADAVENGRS